mmetsp:Transcript_8483/g.20438  ORF Transcript_8483/g.20438 Transcript_8483/m.20438 type:complete len:247 (+) Transcript_8483:130-870(+)
MADPPDLSVLKYENDQEEVCAYVSHEPLPAARRAVYAKTVPVFAAADGVFFSVTTKSPDGTAREFIVNCKAGSSEPEIITQECGITCADVCPSELVEYQFEAPCDGWYLAPATREAMEGYIGYKFKAWHQQLHNPTCEAEFRRLLQNGLVTRLFDRMLFKTPAELADKYEVIDEKSGKKLYLPHPVSGLRIWDAGKKCYESINPRLAGAPKEEEEESYWQEIVVAFKKRTRRRIHRGTDERTPMRL